MIPNKLKGSIIGLFLVTMLLPGFGNLTAQAQYRNRIVQRQRPVVVYRYRPYYWGFRHGSPWGWNDPFYNRTVTVVDPIAQQRESGFRDGLKRGKDDAKKERMNSPTSHKHYRNSNSQTYRQAFLQGYAEGYGERYEDLRYDR
jgi:hypothetical protein